MLADQRVVYSPIPKSGSTSIKSAFLGIDDVHGGDSAHRRGPHRTFDGERVRNDRLRLGDLQLDDHYRFAVVRDDIERFRSYHQRNVVESGSLQRAVKGRDEFFGLPTLPTIDELAINLAKYQYLFLDVRHHTLPTRAYLHRDVDFYDDVFELSELDQLVERLAEHTGTRLEVEHKLRSSAPPSDELSAQARSALASYYGA